MRFQLLQFYFTGAITDSLQKTNGSSSIDVIFLTYWQPTKYEPRKNLEEELAECVEEKLITEGNKLSKEIEL